ncbi:hypothetical protein K437DRAFT_275927 [Tilletiaria anomala UBC 951]|uniref:Uncharacterized protein n=1 Tax=Tilletiaria anomala (strain ATCC 24038 / CBS 436.72 / UBC 951) TaxID=1037660 RepID=A0A066VLY1_TILAU|nr:uncharacterized protein K437DRAFT_275927 [Tilletiaria anomala UBC 951]KDN39759.1 hypothetical protein K437DRAFT_275927 [Tilletiaria anomala UBC 951]
MVVHRLKIDCGEYGKFLAANDGFAAALDFVVSKIGCSQGDVRLHLRDGEELWEVDGGQWDLVQAGDTLVVLTSKGDILHKSEVDVNQRSPEFHTSSTSSNKSPNDRWPSVVGSDTAIGNAALRGSRRASYRGLPPASSSFRAPPAPLGAPSARRSFDQDGPTAPVEWASRRGRFADESSRYGRHQSSPSASLHNIPRASTSRSIDAKAAPRSSRIQGSGSGITQNDGREGFSTRDRALDRERMVAEQREALRIRALDAELERDQRQRQAERESQGKDRIKSFVEHSSAEASSGKRWDDRQAGMFLKKLQEKLRSIIQSEPSPDLSYDRVFKELIGEHEFLSGRSVAALKTRLLIMTKKARENGVELPVINRFQEANSRSSSKRSRNGSRTGSTSGASEVGDDEASREDLQQSRKARKVQSMDPERATSTAVGFPWPVRNSSYPSGRLPPLAMGGPVADSDEEDMSSSSGSEGDQGVGPSSGACIKAHKPLSEEEEQRRIAQTRERFEAENPFAKQRPPQVQRTTPPNRAGPPPTPSSVGGIPPLALVGLARSPPLRAAKKEVPADDEQPPNLARHLPAYGVHADQNSAKAPWQLEEIEKWKSKPPPKMERNGAREDLMGLRTMGGAILSRAILLEKENLCEQVKGYVSSKAESTPSFDAFPFSEAGLYIAGLINAPEHAQDPTGAKVFPAVIYAVYEEMFAKSPSSWSVRKVAMCATILLLFISRHISTQYDRSMPSEKTFRDVDKQSRSFLPHRRFRAYLQCFLLEGCEQGSTALKESAYHVTHPRDGLAALLALRPNSLRPDLVLNALAKPLFDVPEDEVDTQMQLLEDLSIIIGKCISSVDMVSKTPWLAEDHLYIKGGPTELSAKWDVPLKRARDIALPRIAGLTNDGAVAEKALMLVDQINDLSKQIDEAERSARYADRLEDKIIFLCGHGEQLSPEDVREFAHSTTGGGPSLKPSHVLPFPVKNDADILIVILSCKQDQKMLYNKIQRTAWRKYFFKSKTPDFEVLSMQRLGAALVLQQAEKVKNACPT